MTRFQSFDGVSLAFRELGEGRPTLLLHGLLTDADRNWFRSGISARIAGMGRRVIAPDLRGHGGSDAPVAPEAWPVDVLARDQEALLATLGIEDFDVAGYSMGARTALRLMARGARPGRAVLGGMGLSGVVDPSDRVALYEDAIRRASTEAAPAGRLARVVKALLNQGGLRPEALLALLRAQAGTPETVLRTIDVPVLVVSGRLDDDNGPAEALAGALPNARAERVEGDHISAVLEKSFAAAVAGFLCRP